MIQRAMFDCVSGRNLVSIKNINAVPQAAILQPGFPCDERGKNHDGCTIKK
jgi:hypothetical protein